MGQVYYRLVAYFLNCFSWELIFGVWNDLTMHKTNKRNKVSWGNDNDSEWITSIEETQNAPDRNKSYKRHCTAYFWESVKML